MTNQLKAHLGLLSTNLFLAINLSAIKYFTSGNLAGPYGLCIIRIGIAFIMFHALTIASNTGKRMEKKDVIKFLLCALTALAVNQMSFMKGLSYTYPIHVSLLVLVTPILITFMAAWGLKERIGFLKIIGLILGISGAVILIASGESLNKGNNILLGDLLALLSASSYAFYFILVKPLMIKYSSLDIMRVMFTFGFIMILPFGSKEFSEINWNNFHSLEYFLLFLIVVPGTFLAYAFNAYGIKNLSASTAGVYIYSQPVFSVIIAVIFLKETVEIYKLIAGLIIMCGVYLTNMQVKDDRRRSSGKNPSRAGILEPTTL